MQEIIDYWTPETIHNATTRDIRIPKPEALVRKLEVLQWMEDDDDDDDENAGEIFALHFDKVVPYAANCQVITRRKKCRKNAACKWANKQCIEKSSSSTEPEDPVIDKCTGKRKRACRKTRGCAFKNKQCRVSGGNSGVGGTSDKCTGKRKRKCRKTSGCVFENRQCRVEGGDSGAGGASGKCAGMRKKACRRTSGCVFKNRQCQVSGGDTGAGETSDKCAGKRKKACRRTSGCVFKNRQCKASGGGGSDGDTSGGGKCDGLRKKKCKRSTGCNWSGGQCRVDVPTTTTPAPPTVTTTATTSATTTTTTTPEPFTVEYISPKAGVSSEDPVHFEWRVKSDGGGADVIKLVIEYPNNDRAFLDRFPTGDGQDAVTTELNGDGDFRWAVWCYMNGNVVDKGPWQTFQVQGGQPTVADRACYQNLGRYTARNQDLHKAVGRILFRFGGDNYLCSGTLVDGKDDRAIIATAAHCIFDQTEKIFPDYVMFIPGQDDGEGDGSDYNCRNDPHGCFYPTFGVISDEYRAAGFIDAFNYDYGFYVAPDTDPGNENGPDRETFGGSNYASLSPMGIAFDDMSYGYKTSLFGYPASEDAKFMYTTGRADTSPITNGGWYVQCSGLSGGASGGPWTQSDPATGRLTLGSVNSWGWSNGDPGMGSPPFGQGAQCVYDAANAAAMNGGDVVANCPK